MTGSGKTGVDSNCHRIGSGGEVMKFWLGEVHGKAVHVRKFVPLQSYKALLAKKFRGFGIE